MDAVVIACIFDKKNDIVNFRYANIYSEMSLRKRLRGLLADVGVLTYTWKCKG